MRNLQFENKLDSFCNSITEQLKPFYQSDLQPFESYANFFKEKLKNQITSFKNSFVNGYKLIMENLPTEDRERYKIPAFLTEKLLESQEVLQDKKNWQEAMGYSNEMMAEGYKIAKRFYEERNCEKSADIFIFLATLNPFGGWFWQGLGNSWNVLDRNNDALYAFVLALNCLPYSIESYSDLIRCCIKMHYFDEALNVLNYGLKFLESSSKEDREKLINSLKAIHAYVKKLKEEKK